MNMSTRFSLAGASPPPQVGSAGCNRRFNGRFNQRLLMLLMLLMLWLREQRARGMRGTEIAYAGACGDMCGTEIAYMQQRMVICAGLRSRMCRRRSAKSITWCTWGSRPCSGAVPYWDSIWWAAVCRTGIAYGAMPCPVLRQRMVQGERHCGAPVRGLGAQRRRTEGAHCKLGAAYALAVQQARIVSRWPHTYSTEAAGRTARCSTIHATEAAGGAARCSETHGTEIGYGGQVLSMQREKEVHTLLSLHAVHTRYHPTRPLRDAQYPLCRIVPKEDCVRGTRYCCGVSAGILLCGARY